MTRGPLFPSKNFPEFREINLTVFTLVFHFKWNFVTKGHYVGEKRRQNWIAEKIYHLNQSF